MKKILDKLDAEGHFREPQTIVLHHWDLEPRNIKVSPTSTGYKITGIIDWDDALALPRTLARRAPDWIWDFEKEGFTGYLDTDFHPKSDADLSHQGLKSKSDLRAFGTRLRFGSGLVYMLFECVCRLPVVVSAFTFHLLLTPNHLRLKGPKVKLIGITSKMISGIICLGLLSLHQILAATIAAQPAIDISPLNDTDQTNRSRVANDLRFQYTGPASAQEEVQCNGAAYGVYLNLASCYDALRQIDRRDLRPVTFAQRGSLPHAQQPLPLRISSGDGKCVIDIVRPSRGPDRDRANFAAIGEATMKVIGACMDPRQGISRGGSVGRIGL
ncbi:MAG: hypothetical protein Q9182_005732 [Xanthomendoza sp. 2 TL-2023]